MGLVIEVYTKEAFKEFVMPAINNADYSFALNKNFFNLNNDICMEFEVINDVWKIKVGKNYRMYVQEQEVQETAVLKASDIIRISTVDKKQITLMVRMKEEIFGSYAKYDISKVGCITVGSCESNMIQYNYQRIISKEHADIMRSSQGVPFPVKARMVCM